ncbi:MAG: AbrB/MazE/SpoVT family DNA-binding domain-containing protein [Terriglobales bacterium]
MANKSPNPTPYRMLFETTRGRRRLFKSGDPFHADRGNGKIRPNKRDVPRQYEQLVDWYDTVFSRQASVPPLAPANGNNNPAPHQEVASSAVQRTLAAIGELQSGTAFVSAAGAVVIPNNLRSELGIEEGTRLSIYREQNRLVLQPITDEFIHSLVGCLKGEDSLVEAREREHRIEKDRTSG